MRPNTYKVRSGPIRTPCKGPGPVRARSRPDLGPGPVQARSGSGPGPVRSGPGQPQSRQVRSIPIFYIYPLWIFTFYPYILRVFWYPSFSRSGPGQVRSDSTPFYPILPTKTPLFNLFYTLFIPLFTTPFLVTKKLYLPPMQNYILSLKYKDFFVPPIFTEIPYFIPIFTLFRPHPY